jgi:hypothetical protein
MGYYAYQLFDSKKYAKAFFWLIMASFFHKVAFLYLLLFLLMSFCTISKRYAVIIYIVLSVCFFYIDTIMQLLFTVIMNTPYAVYLNKATEMMPPKNNTGLGILSRNIIIPILLLAVQKEKNKRTSNMLILFLCMHFSYLLSTAVYVFNRISGSFIFGWFPMAGHLAIKSKTSMKYRPLILLLLFFWSIGQFIGGSMFLDNTLVPYRTIFSK